MNRWTQQTVALAQDGCRVVTVEAHVYGDWAYCQTPERLRTMFHWGWQIFHVPSGRYYMSTLQQKRLAHKITRRIADLTDWSEHRYGRIPRDVTQQMHAVAWAIRNEARA